MRYRLCQDIRYKKGYVNEPEDRLEMPWKATDVEEQRMEFVIRASEPGSQISQLCREFGVSRPTGYRWRNRYRENGGARGLEEESRRPRHSPRQTAEEVEQRIAVLRNQYGWGARKLQVLLAREGVVVTVVTINRVLQRHRLIGRREHHRPALQRFERAAPNELWQMDGKGQYRLRPEGYCYPLSVIDDHSRFVVGLYALPRFSAETVFPCLVDTFERYGVPDAMLIDHGSVWWSNTNEHGLTEFAVKLMEQEIELIHGRAYHPQTQGKVERFHRTLSERIRHGQRPREWAPWPALLEEIRCEYNEVRPHEALAMKTPASRYQPSRRAYRAEPRRWEYPPGSQVYQLNTQGALEYQQQRWHICEALPARSVRVQTLPGGRVLVSYRGSYIRELDLNTGRTIPLVLPALHNGGLV